MRRRVTLDVAVEEYYQNEPVKKALVRYPLQVVRYAIDAEKIRGAGNRLYRCRTATSGGGGETMKPVLFAFIVQLPGLRH